MPSPGFQVGAVRGHGVVFARGLEIDLANALAARLGIPRVVFYQEPRFDRLIAPGPKPWDIALAEVTITPERAANVLFSVPYLDADQGVLVRRGPREPAQDDRPARAAAPLHPGQHDLRGPDRLAGEAGQASAALRQHDPPARCPAGLALRRRRLRRADPRDAARAGAAALRAARRGHRDGRGVRRRAADRQPAGGRCQRRADGDHRPAGRSGRSRSAGSAPTSRSCPSCAERQGVGRGARGEDPLGDALPAPELDDGRARRGAQLGALGGGQARGSR